MSIVIPVLNEEGNVEPLWTELSAVLAAQPLRHEVIFVDDGSRDRTVERLLAVTAGARDVTIVRLARRFGQTAALAAGFRRARGRVVVTMDGDLQNDPADIPRLVRTIDEPPGWDLVSGWRKDRRDRLLTRRLPSVVANALIGRLTKLRGIHDFGCTLKAYRREILEDIHLYGELHRFLPAMCRWLGGRVTEVEVRHRPRTHGTSKYGLKRTAKVLLDLVTVKFLGDYLAKPLYFFGKIAIFTMLASFASLGVAVAQKLGYLTAASSLPLNRNVLVLFSMMLFLVAFLLVMMGVLSELLVRIYHLSTRTPYYKIRSVLRDGVEVAARTIRSEIEDP